MRWLVVLAITMISSAIPGAATTLKPKTFDQLVGEATAIVESTVIHIRSVKVAEGEFYTFVTMAALKLHKGTYGAETLTLRMRGGTVGDERNVIVGSPVFSTGERVIAFVSDNGNSLIPLVGWEQGLFRIDNGEIVDSRGNLVLEIENGLVRKQARLSGSLEVKDAVGAASDYSRRYADLSAQGSPGRSDDGIPSADAKVAVAGRAMTYDDFVAAVREGVSLAARRGMKSRASTLESAEDIPAPSGAQLARARGGASAVHERSRDDDRVQLPVRVLKEPLPSR